MQQHSLSTEAISLDALKAFAAKLTAGSLMLQATNKVITECEQRAQHERDEKESKRDAWD